MRLVLWRHGRTSWNDEGRFQGFADIPLDETGQRQAAAAAPALRALAPAVTVSSDLERCVSTADALNLPYRTDTRLREIDLGAWSGLTAEQAAAQFPAEDAAWRRGDDLPRGGGETYRDVAVRCGAVVDDLVADPRMAAPGAVALLVLHGGSARALMGRLLGLPPESWYRLGPLGNCRWSVLRDSGTGFRLAQHNMTVDVIGGRGAVEGLDLRDRAIAAAGSTDVPPQVPVVVADDAPAEAPDIEPVHLRRGS